MRISKQNTELLRLEGIYKNGFGIVPKFVMHDPGLTLESKAVYAYLCALAGGGERTFPFRDTILRQLGMSKNTYYRHYNPLIEQGYIAVERPPRRDGANIYTLVGNPKKLAETQAQGEGRLRYTGLKAGGYGALPRAVMTDHRLSVKAKGLYAYFCSYCGAGDCAFPYRDHILHHLGISEPTYYKALAQLKELDYLRIVQRKAGGKFAVNDYYLNEFPGQSPESGADCPVDTREEGQAYSREDTNRDSLHGGDNPSAASSGPCPKIDDSISLPYIKNCDIDSSPHPKNRDTKKGDTKNCAIYILNNNTSNNSFSNDRPDKRWNALQQKAWEYLHHHAPIDADRLLEEFLPRFIRDVQGREVRNLPAYLTASLKTFLAERPLRETPRQPVAAGWGRGESSYDLAEVEAMINRPLG